LVPYWVIDRKPKEPRHSIQKKEDKVVKRSLCRGIHICIMLVSMEGDFEDICPDDYGWRKNLAGILIPHSLGWLLTFCARSVLHFGG